MNHDEMEDNLTYSVLVNAEGQYSIWPAGRDLPAGWSEAGKSGSKQDCLNYINEVWSDARAAHPRRQMNEDGG